MELEERTVGPRQARLDRRGRIVLAEKDLYPVQLSPPKPPSNRRDWRKRIRSTRFLIWVLLILLIAEPVLVYWTVERVVTHNRWSIQASLSETFFGQMNDAYMPITNQSLASDQALRILANIDLHNAGTTIYNLYRVDTQHYNQLSRISTVLLNLQSLTYILNLTSPQRPALANIFLSIGTKIVTAYHLNDTNVYSVPFWYWGPSPPNEILLNQAVDLTKLPGLPCFDYISCNNVPLRW